MSQQWLAQGLAALTVAALAAAPAVAQDIPSGDVFYVYAGITTNNGLGLVVGGAGDADGDGRGDFVVGSSWDYSFVPEMCPSGNVEAITDSDQYLGIEMQPRDHEMKFLRPGPLKPRVLARSLSEWTTVVHRDNARHSVVFHADE